MAGITQPLYPFHKLCRLSTSLIVAAAGPNLYGIDIKQGQVNEAWQVTWQHPQQSPAVDANGKSKEKLMEHSTGELDEDTHVMESEESPTKRRKLDSTTSTEGQAGDSSVMFNQSSEHQETLSRRSSQDSISITTERKKGERRRPKPPQSSESPAANVSHIIRAGDGELLVVITAEDKAITVYDITPQGLHFKSRRTMPKRLCAIDVASRSDKEYLIVGDKFGDVWELPVLEDPNWTPPQSEVVLDEDAANGKKGYEPSATELTVHTKGNLMALEQQRKLKEKQKLKKAAQKNLKDADDATPNKGPGFTFEARLLLGHVSLLTDVAVARQLSSDGSDKSRSFVLTSDRDEHVRVSRYPQSHVIEGFCLGMKEFVSCMEVMPLKTRVVVGTGDVGVRVFDWSSGECLGTDLYEDENTRRDIQQAATCGGTREGEAREALAVSRICQILFEPANEVMLVALEGLPILMSYDIADDGRISRGDIESTAGNVLDIVDIRDGTDSTDVSLPQADQPGPAIIVTFDTAHRPGSTLDYRGSNDRYMIPMAVYGKTKDGYGGWQLDARRTSRLCDALGKVRDTKPVFNSPASGTGGRQVRKGPYSPLGEFLYGLENLRKKRGGAAVDGEDDGEGGVEAEGPMEGVVEG